MTGDVELEKKAARALRAFSSQIASYPMAYTQFLVGVDFAAGPSQEIVIAGDEEDEATRAMVECVRRAFLPNKVLLFRPPGGRCGIDDVAPFVKNMALIGGKAATYWCERFACQAPITDVEKLQKLVAREKRLLALM